METEPGWEQNKAHLYAIEHLGSRYSVKQSSASLRLRTITPVVTTSFGFFRKAEHRELLNSGLRLAAGEAT